jgi:hypothetical protein
MAPWKECFAYNHRDKFVRLINMGVGFHLFYVLEDS